MKTTTIIFTEDTLREVIETYIGVTYNINVVDIKFQTGIRGDYDRGDAVEYVRNVICKCEEL